MFDILQLNDMLVPELQDIAQKLKITNIKKFEKQELIYKILDKQAIQGYASDEKKQTKVKRKIVKAVTPLGTEEAEVVVSSDKIEEDKQDSIVAENLTDKPETEKKIVRKPKILKGEKILVEKNQQITLPLEVEQNTEVGSFEQEGEQVKIIKSEPVQKAIIQKKEPVFNLEFDGISLLLEKIT